MLKARYGKLIGNTIILLVLLLSLVAITWDENSFVARGFHPQNESKKTITEAEWKNPPVRFVKVKVGDKEVKLKEEFENGDDWFKGLTLTVKNVSSKDIKYLEFFLSFPETRPHGFMMSSGQIRYGRYRGIWEQGDDITLKPGDEAEITISGELHNIIKKRLEDQSKYIEGQQFAVKNLKHLDLLLQIVMFSDDTMSLGGEILHRKSPDSNEFVHDHK